MFMASIINLYDIRFETMIQKGSTVICFGLLGVLPIGLIVSLFTIRKFRASGMIGSEEFEKKYKELTMEGEGSRSLIQDNWKVITLFRWSFTSILLVILRQYPQFQMMILLFTSICF